MCRRIVEEVKSNDCDVKRPQNSIFIGSCSDRQALGRKQVKAIMKRKGRREEGSEMERENSGSFCRIFAQEFSGTMEPFRFDELWILGDLKSCAPATNSECRHDVQKIESET